LCGHEVPVIYDGVAALQAARHFAPHVALLDFQMPRLNGGEVARRLRDIPGQEGLVVIATTATALEDICLAGYDGAFDAYLVKPYNLDRLEQLVAGWQHTLLHPMCLAQEDRM
jgi:CheY-like chemotaxis protein